MQYTHTLIHMYSKNGLYIKADVYDVAYTNSITTSSIASACKVDQ